RQVSWLVNGYDGHAKFMPRGVVFGAPQHRGERKARSVPGFGENRGLSPFFALQRSLGRWERAALAGVDLDRGAQRAGEGLEYRLALMVGIVAAQVVDV